MRIAASFAVLALVVVGCASHEGEKQREPEAETGGVPQVSTRTVRAAIASVSLIRDCPDPPPASDAAKSSATAPSPGPAAVPADMPPSEPADAGARMKVGDADRGWSPPCQQSTMQLTLSHDAKETTRFSIKAARLTAAGTGAELAKVPVRGPTRWDDAGRYVEWDESLPASTELKVSYRLGEPDWNLVTKAMGNDDTYGARYVLEVDVFVGGRKMTLRSPEFQREHEHVVVT
jgi:hypothetical protein